MHSNTSMKFAIALAWSVLMPTSVATYGATGPISPQVRGCVDLIVNYSIIRRDIEDASSVDDLNRLYKKARSLVSLTRSPAWQNKFSDGIQAVRSLADKEFAYTATLLNDRSRRLGLLAQYKSLW